MSRKGPVRVLVVDDHYLVRRGTRDILERDPDIEVAGEAEDGEAAVALAARLRPDVVLMDVSLPGMSGLDATRAIALCHPEAKVLVLTIHDDDEYVLGMLDAGAAGYLLKDVRDEELISAVRSVAKGDPVLHPGVTAAVLRSLRARDRERDAGARLTEREAEIVRMVADGSDNREIAKRVGVSVRTVEAHLSNAFRKLAVRTRTEAVMAAIRLGVVQVHEG